MNILFIIKVKLLCSLSGHVSPPIMLTIELKLVIMFCARSLAFFEHMSFW